jgi:hypothetical protein
MSILFSSSMSWPSWEGKAAVLASMWATRSLSTSWPLAGREASGTDRAATRVETDSGLLRRGNLQGGQPEIIYAYTHVGDTDPDRQDPNVFGPPGSGSISPD